MRPALFLAALVALPLAAKTPLTDVALAWKPTKTPTEMGLAAVNLLPFQGRTVAVPPFGDARADPTLLGENREHEKRGEILKVTTKADVPAWITAQTRRFLASTGLPLGEGAPTVTLAGEVVSFFVTEGENYLGDVRLKVTLRKDGRVLWSGMAVGASNHFGRSYKLDNYQETLSDSLQEAWISLLRSPGFLEALAQ